MARIAGVDLPVQKRIWVGLTSIYGIGQPRAKSLCAKANVDHTKKVKDLTEEEINCTASARTPMHGRARVRGRAPSPRRRKSRPGSNPPAGAG